MENIKKPTILLSTLIVSLILIIVNGIIIALNNQPLILASYPANNLSDIWVTLYTKHPPWARVVYGIPGLVEDGLAYGWLSIAILNLIILLYLFVKPHKIKSFSSWIVILSLLTIPIGGGFYIGLLLSFIIGLSGLEYPKKFEDTFIGKMLNALRPTRSFFEKTMANPDVQRAALTLCFVALLSGFGSCLYSYNVYKIYQVGDPLQKPEIASNILLKGALYSEPIVYFSALSNIFVMLIKWLILTLSIYIFAFKIIGKESQLSAILNVTAYVYVPELIMIFLPLIFTNEPNLSQTWALMVLPISWPLILFYISRIWSFIILIYALLVTQDITFLRAVGRTLFAATPYLVIVYLWVYPTFNAPGLNITFTEASSPMVTLLLTIIYVLAILLGALKKD